MTSEGAHDHDPADPTRTTSSAGGTEPVGEIIDAEVLDTEVVDTASPGSVSYTHLTLPTNREV